MAKSILPKPRPAASVRTAADPIDLIQTRVSNVKAICRCLSDAAEATSTYDNDMVGALIGVADLLEGIQLDLDPTEFRAAVLASAKAGVSHV